MPLPRRENEISRQEVLKAEKVVRLELQRREAKKRLALLDAMINEMDRQELFVAQFKKEWLQQRQEWEVKRQRVIQKEASERARVEAAAAANRKDVVSNFYASLRLLKHR